jgi:hypothetical protein
MMDKGSAVIGISRYRLGRMPAFLALLPLILCVTPLKAADATKPFSGHYYLSGIREVGSELLLKADGSYEWFLSYGAVDQFSKGHWIQKDMQISLIPDAPDNKNPLFTAEPMQPWDEDAEQNVQDALRDTAAEAIYQRCPFLINEGGISTVSTFPAMLSREATKENLAAVEVAKGVELADRLAYETTAAKAMAGDALDDKLQALAGSARMSWEESAFALRLAKDAAGLPVTQEPEPKLPAKCKVPRYATRSVDLPPEQWTRGFTVHIHDPEVEQNFSGVIVTFHYSDGTISKRTSDNGGYAWVPLRDGATINSVDLGITLDKGPRQESIGFQSTRDGVLPIIFRSRAVTPAAFDVMTLKIEGTDLIGFEGRGRYHREP